MIEYKMTANNNIEYIYPNRMGYIACSGSTTEHLPCSLPKWPLTARLCSAPFKSDGVEFLTNKS